MNGPAPGQDDVDFEAFYQGMPAIDGVDVTFDVAPWDIGEPQPPVVALQEAGAVGPTVLDAGCGPGDNAIFLAGRGHHVTGVDGAATALDTARQRARERGVEVTFVHDDVTTMDSVPEGFDTVLDSALFHCLGERQRRSYAATAHRVTAPGARLHLFCFADGEQGGLRVPMVVGKDELYAQLGGYWNITGIEATHYVTAMTLEALDRVDTAQLAQAGFAVDRDRVRTDEWGRILGRMWYLHAERARV